MGPWRKEETNLLARSHMAHFNRAADVRRGKSQIIVQPANEQQQA